MRQGYNFLRPGSVYVSASRQSFGENCPPHTRNARFLPRAQSLQEPAKVHARRVPCQHLRGRESPALCKKGSHLSARYSRGRGVLSADGQGQTHRTLQDRQGSYDRNIEGTEFLRRGPAARPISPDVPRDRNEELLGGGGGKKC